MLLPTLCTLLYTYSCDSLSTRPCSSLYGLLSFRCFVLSFTILCRGRYSVTVSATLLSCCGMLCVFIVLIVRWTVSTVRTPCLPCSSTPTGGECWAACGSSKYYGLCAASSKICCGIIYRRRVIAGDWRFLHIPRCACSCRTAGGGESRTSCLQVFSC